MSDTNKKQIICPHCGKPDTWVPTNPNRPFCSDRCKLIDLGEWAKETRRIPGEEISKENTEDGESQ